MAAVLTQEAMFARGVALQQQGDLEAAATLLQSVIAEQPDHVEALLQFGVLRLQQDRPADALPVLERAAQLAPDSAKVLANLGTVLQALGRSDEAIFMLRAAVAQQPDFVEARYALATTQQAAGQAAEAAACFEAILATAPDHLEARYGLASARVRLGQTDAAIAEFQTVLDADPDFAEARVALGESLLQQRRFTEAEPHFRHALDVDPDYLEARLWLGRALLELKQDAEAEASFLQVLRVEADSAEAKCGLAALRHRQKRDAEALSLCEAVVADHPGHGGAQLGMANALQSLGRLEEAIAAFQSAVAMNPNSGEAHGGLGEALAEFGRLEEARSAFERAITLMPDQPSFCLRLTNLGKVRAGDPVVAALEALAAQAETFPEDDQVRLHFALAKVGDDLGDRDSAFRHYLAGNAANRRTVQYDEAPGLAMMRRIAEVFSAELLAARSGLGHPSDVPVFIVGMPRSGSTLVEQILASHSAVFGAGERSELPDVLQRVAPILFGGLPRIEMVLTMDAVKLRALGSEYVSALRKLAPGAERITDKLLGNFMRIGLIHLALPNARIIHTMRDPIDSCLSSFSRLFAPGELPFAYDLAELGRYYHAYRQLMAHWRRVLPPGKLLEVQYEDVVDDLETHARQIVDHCGLPWDSACLEFHQLERSVRTASQAQVRQPLYRSSVGRWRPEETLLRPLLDGLAGH